MTRRLVAGRLFASEPFFLADVGASGGIEDHWRVFGDQLRAAGFDPLVKECARLNRSEVSPNIRYHALYIGGGDRPTYLSPASGDGSTRWTNQPYARTSSARAQQAAGVSATTQYNNWNPAVTLAGQVTSLDNFFSEHPVQTVDFIKIDTDGQDYDVLLGARETLRRYPVLGLFVEIQFHGALEPEANVFSNIDGLLRGGGFSLFDLEVYRYTRACLPGRFVHAMPAQTKIGQVLWGDALYLRDAAIPGFEDYWKVRLSPQKLLKLACLFELYGMPDCAAEILLSRRVELEGFIDVDRCLGLLVRQVDPWARSFAGHNRRFDIALKSFFPVKARAMAWIGSALSKGLTRRGR